MVWRASKKYFLLDTTTEPLEWNHDDEHKVFGYKAINDFVVKELTSFVDHMLDNISIFVWDTHPKIDDEKFHGELYEECLCLALGDDVDQTGQHNYDPIRFVNIPIKQIERLIKEKRERDAEEDREAKILRAEFLKQKKQKIKRVRLRRGK